MSIPAGKVIEWTVRQIKKEGVEDKRASRELHMHNNY